MRYKNPGDIISGALDVRDRIRTHDLLVRSQSLYPAELHALTITDSELITSSATLNIIYYILFYVNIFF